MAEFDEVEHDRDYPREILHAKTEIKIDEQWHECVLVNISSNGAKLLLDMVTTRGMPVFVRMGKFGPFSATVAWSKGNEVGVKFDDEPEEMTRVLIELEKLG